MILFIRFEIYVALEKRRLLYFHAKRRSWSVQRGSLCKVIILHLEKKWYLFDNLLPCQFSTRRISSQRQAFHFGLGGYTVIMDIVTYSIRNILQSYYFNFFFSLLCVWAFNLSFILVCLRTVIIEQYIVFFLKIQLLWAERRVSVSE